MRTYSPSTLPPLAGRAELVRWAAEGGRVTRETAVNRFLALLFLRALQLGGVKVPGG